MHDRGVGVFGGREVGARQRSRPRVGGGQGGRRWRDRDLRGALLECGPSLWDVEREVSAARVKV